MAWIWRLNRLELIDDASLAASFEVKKLCRVFERIKQLWQRRSSPSVILAGGALRNGCATIGFEQTKPPVTVSDVIQLSKEDVPAEIIVKKMRESRAVYRLSAGQLAQLHDQGVSNPVLDYMQETYLGAVRLEQIQADWMAWDEWRDHFW
jgi:hypothetical protein